MILLNSNRWFWVFLLEAKLLSGIDPFSIVFNKIIQNSFGDPKSQTPKAGVFATRSRMALLDMRLFRSFTYLLV